jgi:aminomethyltransferase
MSTPIQPKVAGGVLQVSSHRYLRSPFFAFYDHPQARYGVYNQRLYPLDLGGDTVAEYWKLRREAMLYDVPERPLEIRGPDAVRLLEKVFVRRCAGIGVHRAAYGLACDANGGLLMDGVLLRLAADRFWYVMADGEFLPWLEAHAIGLDVQVFDPEVWVLQVQGPRSLEILRAIADPAPPAEWKYFGVAETTIAGQPVVLSRTGWTGELGFEIYTPMAGARNAALWDLLLETGAAFGLQNGALSSMAIRRIEGGILDYGTDVDRSVNPWQAGLGRFVDMEKDDFIGKSALVRCDRRLRLQGLSCDAGAPQRGGAVYVDGREAGHVTASAQSPQLGCGIGYALFREAAPEAGSAIEVQVDGVRVRAVVTELPFYDAEKRIARGLSMAET